LKELNLELFFSLASPVARRLYRFLSKKLHRRGQYEIDIFQLAEQLGMARYRYPAKVLEKLRPGVEELKGRGLLAGASIVKVKGYTRLRFIKGRPVVPTHVISEPKHKDATVPPRKWREQVAIAHGISEEQRGLWDRVLAQVEKSTSQAIFSTWVARTQLLELQGGTAVIGLPNEYAKTMMEGRMRESMQDALEDGLGRRVTLQFRVLCS